MKSAFAVAFAVAAGAAALPAPQAGTTTPLLFAGMALDSGTPIHFGQINANAKSFWIGKNTTTYCPSTSVDCSNVTTNKTIFTYTNGAGSIGLHTEVPGGQSVYVAQGNTSIGQLPGELLFTEAHSGVTSGPALYTGFTNEYPGYLKFEGKDWHACPVDNFNSGYGKFKQSNRLPPQTPLTNFETGIWAESRSNGLGSGCLVFTWSLVQLPSDTAPAWQYE